MNKRARRRKSSKFRNANPRQENGDRQDDLSSGPALSIEALEPRILLSATWVEADTGDAIPDATEGDDIYTGSNQDDVANALGGDDVMNGGQGDDQLFGGAGNDQLFGGQGKDTLISGGGNDLMDGGIGNDTFKFDGAQDGDVITVDGGSGGQDTIDLSGYTDNQINDDGSTITVDMGSGESFTINYSNISNITTGGSGNTAPTADIGSTTVNEDTSATISLSGTDPDTGDAVEQYRIDSLPANGTLKLNGNAVSAGDTIAQADIDSGALTFDPDADWNGSTDFNFSASDGDDWSGSPAAFTVNVNAVPDAPSQPDQPSAPNSPDTPSQPDQPDEPPTGPDGNVPTVPNDDSGDQPTVPGSNDDGGARGSQWDGNEGLQVMDASAEMTGRVEFLSNWERGEVSDLEPAESAEIESRFDVAPEVELAAPGAGLAAKQPDLEFDVAQEQFGDVFEDGESVSHAQEAAFAQPESDHDLPPVPETEGPPLGEAHVESDVAPEAPDNAMLGAADAEPVGFFARLWGLVRGTAATSRHTEELVGAPSRDRSGGRR